MATDIRPVLRALGVKTLDAISLLEEKDKTPFSLRTYRHIFNKYNYTEEGILGSIFRTEEGFNKVWIRPFKAIWELAEVWGELDSSMAALSEEFPKYENTKGVCSSYMISIIQDAMDSSEETSRIIDRTVDIVLKEVSGVPLEYKAIVELNGLSLFGINFGFEINGVKYRLRQIEQDDLEREIPFALYGHNFPGVFPSGVLEVQMDSTHPGGVQRKALEVIVALRLFVSALVDQHSYRIESPSVLNQIGESRGGVPKSTRTAYVKDIEAKFPEYFGKLRHILPPGPHRPDVKSLGPEKIAYDRYIEALQGGIIEQRIAAAIMGLEALLSDGGDNLRYKLAVRSSCLLAILGLEPLVVRDIVGSGYKIRNSYVHADPLKPTKMEGLVAPAGGGEKFIQQLNDYLRLCLIVFLCLGKKKLKVVSLIDDAVLDKEHRSNLEAMLKEAQSLVTLTSHPA